MAIIGKNEVIERLRSGEDIHWVEWGGFKYRLGNDTVRYDTVSKLICGGLVIKYRSKSSPLTGIVRWKNEVKENGKEI